MTVAVWALCLYLQDSLPRMHLSPGWRWGLSLVFVIDALFTLVWSALTLAAAHREDKPATTGPYALVRHPMYGALLWSGTAAIAFTLESWVVLLGVIPLHIGWIVLAQREERLLVQTYGATYRKYAQETGQFLPRMSSLKKMIQNPNDIQS